MQKNNETIDNLTRIGNSLHLQQNYLSYIKFHQNTQLIMIDVENFKQINDTFGHNIGDLYLKTVAQLLTKNFPDSLVTRVHGDEFIVLTNQNENQIRSGDRKVAAGARYDAGRTGRKAFCHPAGGLPLGAGRDDARTGNADAAVENV